MSLFENLKEVIGVLFVSFLYYIFGYKIILLFNAFSYFIASFMEKFISIDEIDLYRNIERKSLFLEMQEGLMYLKNKNGFLELIKINLVSNIFIIGVYSITLTFMINVNLQLPQYIYSITLASIGLGGIVTSIFVKKIKIDIHKNMYKSLISYAFIFTLTGIIYLLFFNKYINQIVFASSLFLLYYFFGCLTTYMSIPINEIYAKRIEKEYMGRVMAFRGSMSMFSIPISAILFGYVIERYNVFITLIICAIGMFLNAIFAYKSKELKLLRENKS